MLWYLLLFLRYLFPVCLRFACFGRNFVVHYLTQSLSLLPNIYLFGTLTTPWLCFSTLFYMSFHIFLSFHCVFLLFPSQLPCVTRFPKVGEMMYSSDNQFQKYWNNWHVVFSRPPSPQNQCWESLVTLTLYSYITKMRIKANTWVSNFISTLILGERGKIWPSHQRSNIFWNWLSEKG